jgi:hypothetical protein
VNTQLDQPGTRTSRAKATVLTAAEERKNTLR